MTQRLLKKYLLLFGRTIKHGKVSVRSARRHPAEHYLLPSHPLACRRRDRAERERARVLPALLKAKISDTIKIKLRNRVAEERQADELPTWVEQGNRPRRRLWAPVLYLLDWPDYAGGLQQHRAEVNRRKSALLRERPQLLGKRIQSGNRVQP